ncbi:hypothetical protein H4R33_004889 [Dimargaris cristalligena]|uniref:Uncharacterized protein n=1 Tax=Dimargaris cristalligena TaxID=215637 RepID=A0A4P9ZUA4_9FUNG|nr:hypothetical protein H4R33_004889 [Dimargaris cristalligena]RKP37134.1 hypothetical protein BJ085DRAFT_35676 [Dimargaris cristalligena]|eukprot:RKP37134.1 hypothetical protein BJ085DRAFT_35676 [Dimargaris cristalligena]
MSSPVPTEYFPLNKASAVLQWLSAFKNQSNIDDSAEPADFTMRAKPGQQTNNSARNSWRSVRVVDGAVLDQYEIEPHHHEYTSSQLGAAHTPSRRTSSGTPEPHTYDDTQYDLHQPQPQHQHQRLHHYQATGEEAQSECDPDDFMTAYGDGQRSVLGLAAVPASPRYATYIPSQTPPPPPLPIIITTHRGAVPKTPVSAHHLFSTDAADRFPSSLSSTSPPTLLSSSAPSPSSSPPKFSSAPSIPTRKSSILNLPLPVHTPPISPATHPATLAVPPTPASVWKSNLPVQSLEQVDAGVTRTSTGQARFIPCKELAITLAPRRSSEDNVVYNTTAARQKQQQQQQSSLASASRQSLSAITESGDRFGRQPLRLVDHSTLLTALGGNGSAGNGKRNMAQGTSALVMNSTSAAATPTFPSFPTISSTTSSSLSGSAAFLSTSPPASSNLAASSSSHATPYSLEDPLPFSGQSHATGWPRPLTRHVLPSSSKLGKRGSSKPNISAPLPYYRSPIQDCASPSGLNGEHSTHPYLHHHNHSSHTMSQAPGSASTYSLANAASASAYSIHQGNVNLTMTPGSTQGVLKAESLITKMYGYWAQEIALLHSSSSGSGGSSSSHTYVSPTPKMPSTPAFPSNHSAAAPQSPRSDASFWTPPTSPTLPPSALGTRTYLLPNGTSNHLPASATDSQVDLNQSVDYNEGSRMGSNIRAPVGLEFIQQRRVLKHIFFEALVSDPTMANLTIQLSMRSTDMEC